jgi:hypothetical protein
MISASLAQFSSRVLRWRIVLPVFALLWGVYLLGLHPSLMNWGATPAEAGVALPGDEPGLAPDAYFTRAITIDASPSVVWPWLVQMGQDRAGFYTYNWLENLVGADIHNANSIHPEWQPRAIGDIVPLARPDLLFGVGAMGHSSIVVLEPERAIGYITPRFVLQPTLDGGTLLLARETLDSQGPMLTRLLIWDAMHFTMVQRMLRGIQERATGQPLVPAGLVMFARVGWLLAGAGVFAVLASRRRWWPWLAVTTAILVPALVSTGDWDAALAGFLAIGISVCGALVFGRRWWPAYLLIASAVLLVLVVAPDAWTAFGLVFDGLAIGGLATILVSRPSLRQPTRPLRVGARP